MSFPPLEKAGICQPYLPEFQIVDTSLISTGRHNHCHRTWPPTIALALCILVHATNAGGANDHTIAAIGKTIDPSFVLVKMTTQEVVDVVPIQIHGISCDIVNAGITITMKL